MSDHAPPRLPIRFPTPASPRARRFARVGRIGEGVLLALVLVFPLVQFVEGTVENVRKGRQYDRAVVEGRAEPGLPVKRHKGAIGRWRRAARAMWAGQNIYKQPPSPEQLAAGDIDSTGQVYLHPNMPFTVVLLTPFGYLPPVAAAAVWTLLKVLVLLATLLMVARVAAHGQRRLSDWVLALGLLFSALFIMGDIQHGNTNVFVLGAIVAHLYFYRRGRDAAGGAALALAVCIKMTPAIFVLYWLYQRSWRLLAWTLAFGLIFAVVVPAALLGPSDYADLTGSWLDNLIFPGLRGAWYPIHINQSIHGVAARYFLDGPEGDIYYNPDDYAYYKPYAAVKEREGFSDRWITLVELSPGTLKWIIRGLQLAVVGLIAWAIGWRRLPRDDGRRALHYGLVALGMLLLNQRTWDHHATVTMIATVAIWQALGYGRMSRAARIAALTVFVTAGVLECTSGTELFKLAARLSGESSKLGDRWADRLKAYGPTFYQFVLMFAGGVICARSLKRREEPYAEVRQPLGKP